MKTKTLITLLALTAAQSASAVTVRADLTNGVAAMPGTSSNGASLQVNANATVGNPATNTVTVEANTNTSVNATASGTAETEGIMAIQSSANTVSSVDTSSDNKVTVKYERPAKLFGFIPMTITERATVKIEDDGTRTADVSKSWWSFMASTEAKTDAFLAQLKSRLQASAKVNASATLTESEKTELVSEINAAADATYR